MVMRFTALRHTLFLDFDEVFTPQTGKVGGGGRSLMPLPSVFLAQNFYPLTNCQTLLQKLFLDNEHTFDTQ